MQNYNGKWWTRGQQASPEITLYLVNEYYKKWKSLGFTFSQFLVARGSQNPAHNIHGMDDNFTGIIHDGASPAKHDDFETNKCYPFSFLEAGCIYYFSFTVRLLKLYRSKELRTQLLSFNRLDPNYSQTHSTQIMKLLEIKRRRHSSL